ncbi:hypothetical protein Pmani_012175 [Petrolisthes manimaculis]|uniref:Uncharacterized protein n=1 Tax=Petrolisthes manimaculis TaxID=1843537 RepID=A0AAE1PXW8_9EUCA|nr:hypothetical protein Pmani_012175 [Petrolisthes manimaculis]
MTTPICYLSTCSSPPPPSMHISSPQLFSVSHQLRLPIVLCVLVLRIHQYTLTSDTPIQISLYTSNAPPPLYRHALSIFPTAPPPPPLRPRTDGRQQHHSHRDQFASVLLSVFCLRKRGVKVS